jgi:hypothetical protein
MATALYFEDVVNTAGVRLPASPGARWPEGGASIQARLSVGACVVGVEVSNILGVYDEIVEVTLPVPAGDEGAGALVDSISIPAHYRGYRYNVKSITGGGTLTLGLAGIGT